MDVTKRVWELTQKEYEELARFPAEVSHEVDDQIEAHCLCELQRYIDNDASNCLNHMLVTLIGACWNAVNFTSVAGW
jgi:hypothetical protein